MASKPRKPLTAEQKRHRNLSRQIARMAERYGRKPTERDRARLIKAEWEALRVLLPGLPKRPPKVKTTEPTKPKGRPNLSLVKK